MASETLKDSQVYDLLELSDSDVSDWVPESDEGLDLDEDEGSSQPEAEPENCQQSEVSVPGPSTECAAAHDGGPTTAVPQFLPKRTPGLNLPEFQTRQDIQKYLRPVDFFFVLFFTADIVQQMCD